MDPSEWEYIPGFITFSDNEFSNLEKQLHKICRSYIYKIYGKNIPSPRVSCVFVLDIDEAKEKTLGKASFNYKEIPMYSWDDAPDEIRDIRKHLQDVLSVDFDYVLAHIYRDRNDHIGFHSDDEALNSDIISVSLGSTRRFQLRPFRHKKGYTHEYIVNNGDIIYMKGPCEKDGRKDGCQRLYKHCVPKMNISDMKRHLNQRGISIPLGSKTYKMLDQIARTQNAEPVRINLTFRQYE